MKTKMKKKEKIVFQNKWCRVVLIDNTMGVYKLVSKSGKYNDQYFTSLSDLEKSIGMKLPKKELKWKSLNKISDGRIGIINNKRIKREWL